MSENGEESSHDCFGSEPARDETYATRGSLFERLVETEPEVRRVAWNEFRERYAPVIASFASKCNARQQDIDDIIQDVMTNFLSQKRDFVYDPQKGRFRSYLKTCTVRAAIRRAGTNLRYQGLPLSEVPNAELAMESLWDDIWEQQLVEQALRIVRDKYVDSITFRAFEQYVLLDRPAKVVASELNVDVNNVHQAKVRVIKRLKETVDLLRNASD